MKTIYKGLLLLIFLLGISIQTKAQNDLIITGVFDGPLSGGLPKVVELYVVNNITDLTVYGIGSANNGGGTDDVEYQLTGSATAGDFIYLTSDAVDVSFNTYFGFNATQSAGSAVNVNGDDALELFYDASGVTVGMSATVVDIFGDINVDGSGQPWEYLDGWAYRNNGTGPDGSTFTLGNWTFSGINAVDGCTDNSSCGSMFPIGTYTSGTSGTSLAIAATDAIKFEGNSGTTPFTFTVTRSGDTSGATDVNYAVTGSGTNAADAADFGGTFPSGMVSFASGETSKTITIDVSGDTDVEPDEEFTVTLSNPTGGATITTATADGTIQNDENAVLAIAAADADKAEGNSGTTAFTFTVTRSGDTSGATAVDWETSGTGTGGVDLAQSTDIDGGFSLATLNFDAGETMKTITVNVLGDTDVESDEGFTVTLTNATGGATITTSDANGIIRNDDGVVSDIVTLRNAINADGEPTTTGLVTVTGIVYGVNTQSTRIGLTLISGTNAAREGIGLFINDSEFADLGITGIDDFVEGDELTVTGEVGTFRGLMQIVNLSTITKNSSGNSLQTAATVTTLDEDSESRFITLEGVTVDESTWEGSSTYTGSGFNVDVTLEGTTFTLRIDGDTDLATRTFAEVFTGGATVTYNIEGIGGQFASSNTPPFADGYQIGAWKLGNITVVPTSSLANNLQNAKLTVFPNPAQDIVRVKIEGQASKSIKASLYTNLGKKVSEGVYRSNEFEMNIENLEAGKYILVLEVGREKVARQLVKF